MKFFKTVAPIPVWIVNGGDERGFEKRFEAPRRDAVIDEFSSRRRRLDSLYLGHYR